MTCQYIPIFFEPILWNWRELRPQYLLLAGKVRIQRQGLPSPKLKSSNRRRLSMKSLSLKIIVSPSGLLYETRSHMPPVQGLWHVQRSLQQSSSFMPIQTFISFFHLFEFFFRDFRIKCWLFEERFRKYEIFLKLVLFTHDPEVHHLLFYLDHKVVRAAQSEARWEV